MAQFKLMAAPLLYEPQTTWVIWTARWCNGLSEKEESLAGTPQKAHYLELRCLLPFELSASEILEPFWNHSGTLYHLKTSFFWEGCSLWEDPLVATGRSPA